MVGYNSLQTIEYKEWLYTRYGQTMASIHMQLVKLYNAANQTEQNY